MNKQHTNKTFHSSVYSLFTILVYYQARWIDLVSLFMFYAVTLHNTLEKGKSLYVSCSALSRFWYKKFPEYCACLGLSYMSITMENAPALVVTMEYDLGFSAAAYLLVFHVCFVMFCWTYWKAIFTPAATPSKKVPGVDVFDSYGLPNWSSAKRVLFFCDSSTSPTRTKRGTRWRRGRTFRSRSCLT